MFKFFISLLKTDFIKKHIKIKKTFIKTIRFARILDAKITEEELSNDEVISIIQDGVTKAINSTKKLNVEMIKEKMIKNKQMIELQEELNIIDAIIAKNNKFIEDLTKIME
jgi:uncharacterized protein YjaZ